MLTHQKSHTKNENQESNTGICGEEIKIYGKSEGKQQKSEQNKEDSEQMIKDKK